MGYVANFSRDDTILCDRELIEKNPSDDNRSVFDGMAWYIHIDIINRLFIDQLFYINRSFFIYFEFVLHL